MLLEFSTVATVTSEPHSSYIYSDGESLLYHGGTYIVIHRTSYPVGTYSVGDLEKVASPPQMRPDVEGLFNMDMLPLRSDEILTIAKNLGDEPHSKLHISCDPQTRLPFLFCSRQFVGGVTFNPWLLKRCLDTYSNLDFTVGYVELSHCLLAHSADRTVSILVKCLLDKSEEEFTSHFKYEDDE